jgi:hypothetical protein
MIIHHDQVGFTLEINKCNTAHEQNQEQKLYDLLNKCRKNLLTIPHDKSSED